MNATVGDSARGSRPLLVYKRVGIAEVKGSVAKFEVVASTDCHGCSERGSQALNLIRD
ncbi:hypothetical protein J2W52_005470 [Rhizobium miluonense]|uniref:Uncharacterized protein n=1 Tax=Rhizobium miluonense TaxID=411945 RepID=A0ABU1SZE3_9HYPH|nr:hypothetical protein [Rhizobium miluonense]